MKRVVDVDDFLRLVRDALERCQAPEPPPPVAKHEPWISIAEASAYASVGEDTVREWVRLRALPAGRQGRVIRLRRSDIDTLLLSGASAAESSSGASAPDESEARLSARAAEILRSLDKPKPKHR